MISHTVARETRSQAALRAAASISHLRPYVVQNPAASHTMWQELWPEKLPAADLDAWLPLGPQVSADRVSQLLATERRSAFLTRAIQVAERVTPGHLEQLTTNSGMSDRVLWALLNRRVPLTPTWLRAVARRSWHAQVMYWATTEADGAEIEQALASWPRTDLPHYASLDRVLAARTSLLPAAATSPNGEVRAAAARSRHLTDETLQLKLSGVDAGKTVSDDEIDEHLERVWAALLTNQVSCPRVVERIGDRVNSWDSDQLTILCARRAFSGQRYLKGPLETETDQHVLRRFVTKIFHGESNAGLLSRSLASWDLPALLANPHLDSEMRAEIEVQTVRYWHELRLDPVVFDAATAALSLDEVEGKYALASDDQERARERGAEYWSSSACDSVLRWASTKREAPSRETIAGDIRDGNVRLTDRWVRSYRAVASRQVAVLDEAVRDSEDAWQMVLTMLSGDFAGTTEELAALVNKVTGA